MQKARQVYTAVVKPIITYGAAIWHAAPGTSEAKMPHVKKLALEQNGCLRAVLGAYNATPTAALEAESNISSIQIASDHAVFRMQALRGIHPATKADNMRIQKSLCKKKQNQPNKNTCREN